MHIALFTLTVLVALSFTAACASVFDILVQKAEDLSETLYLRASWKDVWLNLVPRAEYPRGAGYQRSTFEIGRSEPATDEEPWTAIQANNSSSTTACTLTYTDVQTGFHRNNYAPEAFGMAGPPLCQDDLTMGWQSGEFWEKYFQAIEKRDKRSVSNRLGNVYRQYVPKASCNANLQWYNGDTATQPAPAYVDLSMLINQLPNSELTQEMLDSTAQTLMEASADDPNSNGWITMNANGPVFPLYIGLDMSNRILINNSEFRSDLNQAWQGWKELNPVLKRVGATTIIKNFRHVINRFPARWALVGTGTTINYVSSGYNATTQPLQSATVTVAGTTGTVVIKALAAAPNPNGGGTPYAIGDTIRTFTVTALAGSVLLRIPTFAMDSSTATVVTKGSVATVNGVWRDASIASFESAEVLTPWVMTEEVLMPVNSLPGAKLNPQNYMGEWNFVTGNDAFIGISGCAGISDPMKKQGRHFAEYRSAKRPVFADYGRMFLFKRCSSSLDIITCS